MSRTGAGCATGIDRVERAYLATLLDGDTEITGLVRHAGGVSVLDRPALCQLRDLDEIGAGGPRDAVGLLSRRIGHERQRGESWVRRHATATVWRGTEARRLRRKLPTGVTYLNVGHANLCPATLSEVASVARVGVMIHDVIPLRHPEFQRPGSPERFRAKLAAAAEHADLVISPSVSEAAHVSRWLARLGGRAPARAVAPGPTLARPDPGLLPDDARSDRPYFVALGTIEPRKNVDLLLDLWEPIAADGADGPILMIVGRRGWASDATFARLDALKSARGPVREFNGLADGAVGALLARARALLFPTLAEGYGFPPHEALALGTPVVCSDLDVLRETLGERAVYADPRDVVQWAGIVRHYGTLQRAAGENGRVTEAGCGHQSWRSHLETVLRALG